MPHPKERWCSRTHVCPNSTTNSWQIWYFDLVERPTQTWTRSQVASLLRPSMPPFSSEVRWHGIALSTVLTVRVLHDDLLQYRPANKKHLFWASLRFFFVGPQRHPTLLYPISYPPKVSNHVFLHVCFERVCSYWRWPFWKGAPCFECAEVQGAGSRNEYSRQQPRATEHLRYLYHTKEKKVTKGGQSTYFMCIFNVKTTTTSSTIQPADHSMNVQPWLLIRTRYTRREI